MIHHFLFVIGWHYPYFQYKTLDAALMWCNQSIFLCSEIEPSEVVQGYPCCLAGDPVATGKGRRLSQNTEHGVSGSFPMRGDRKTPPPPSQPNASLYHTAWLWGYFTIN